MKSVISRVAVTELLEANPFGQLRVPTVSPETAGALITSIHTAVIEVLSTGIGALITDADITRIPRVLKGISAKVTQVECEPPVLLEITRIVQQLARAALLKSTSPKTSGASRQLGRYLTKVGDTPLLTRDDEKELGRRMDLKGPDADLAREVLITANLRLVVSIAHQFRNRGVDLNDLIQEGNIGLMKAAEGFDHTRGVKFSTYATYRIREAISRAIDDQKRTIRLPVYKIELLSKVEKERRGFVAEHKVEPSDDYLASKVDIEKDELLALRVRLKDLDPLDAPIIEGGKETVQSTTVDKDAANPLEEFLQTETRESLEEAFIKARLTPREEHILRRRAGFGWSQAESHDTIAEALGFTRKTIQNDEKRALKKLNRHLACVREELLAS